MTGSASCPGEVTAPTSEPVKIYFGSERFSFARRSGAACDGIYEVTKPDGSMWKFERFVDGLLVDQPVVPRKIETVKQIRGSNEFEDDVSILEVRFAG
jgi:hypothetical protein